MRLMDMTSSDIWHLMLDYYSFYTDEDETMEEEGGDDNEDLEE